MTEWKPIETMPERTLVLAKHKHYGVMAGFRIEIHAQDGTFRAGFELNGAPSQYWYLTSFTGWMEPPK